MTTLAPHERRVLAIDPTTRGFRFAVLESPTDLIDWGVKATRIDNQRSLAKPVSWFDSTPNCRLIGISPYTGVEIVALLLREE